MEKGKMFTEEKKKKTNYGTIFVYCVFCFVLVVEVARLAKPYYSDLQSLKETGALAVEEGFVDVEQSGVLPPCHSMRSRRSAFVPARNHEKLTGLVRREDRTRPPSSYCVKFESFETMAKLVIENGDKYESRPFSVGGYNWTLVIYPNQNKPVGSGGFVSLYVRIDNSTLIANPRDVYAQITFMTYRSTTDKWLFVQETDAQRFHLFRQEWGHLNFLEIGYYKSSSTAGYIFNGGQSVFGVDIFVSDPFKDWEVFSYEENIRDPVFSWQLTRFSTRNLYSYTSDSFSSGGRNWVLKVYPNGVGAATGNSLSLYLLSASNEKGYVKAKLRVIDQNRSSHVEKQVEGWPNATENGWGLEKLIPLADIKDTSKGFLVGDTLKVEVEILSFSKTDSR